MILRRIALWNRPSMVFTRTRLTTCRSSFSTHRASSSVVASDDVDAELSASLKTTTRVYSSLVDDSKQQHFMEYARGWAWQQVLLSRRLELRRIQQNNQHACTDDDCVLMLQHQPVYTLGRGADENHVVFLQDDSITREKLSRKSRGAGSARLAMDKPIDCTHNLEPVIRHLANSVCPVMAPNGAPIYRIDRGGEVTFHGPGQLVVYPLLDLKRPPYQQDLHWYLRQLEQVVIDTLQFYGIESCRDDDNTGVWVEDHKICAVGVSCARWITTHGLALNVDCDLDFFDTSVILPCGIEGKGVTSISQVLQERQHPNVPTVQEVADVVLSKMQHVFGMESIQHGKHIH